MIVKRLEWRHRRELEASNATQDSVTRGGALSRFLLAPQHTDEKETAHPTTEMSGVNGWKRSMHMYVFAGKWLVKYDGTVWKKTVNGWGRRCSVELFSYTLTIDRLHAAAPFRLCRTKQSPDRSPPGRVGWYSTTPGCQIVHLAMEWQTFRTNVPEYIHVYTYWNGRNATFKHLQSDTDLKK